MCIYSCVMIITQSAITVLITRGPVQCAVILCGIMFTSCTYIFQADRALTAQADRALNWTARNQYSNCRLSNNHYTRINTTHFFNQKYVYHQLLGYLGSGRMLKLSIVTTHAILARHVISS